MSPSSGANIPERLIEIVMGLLVATSTAWLFALFPTAIIGAMMLLVGTELTKFARDIRVSKELIPRAVTLSVSVVSNMPYGFLTGLMVCCLTRFFSGRNTSKAHHTNGARKEG